MNQTNLTTILLTSATTILLTQGVAKLIEFISAWRKSQITVRNYTVLVQNSILNLERTLLILEKNLTVIQNKKLHESCNLLTIPKDSIWSSFDIQSLLFSLRYRPELSIKKKEQVIGAMRTIYNLTQKCLVLAEEFSKTITNYNEEDKKYNQNWNESILSVFSEIHKLYYVERNDQLLTFLKNFEILKNTKSNDPEIMGENFLKPIQQQLNTLTFEENWPTLKLVMTCKTNITNRINKKVAVEEKISDMILQVKTIAIDLKRYVKVLRKLQ